MTDRDTIQRLQRENDELLARLETSEANHKETLQHQVTQARAERSDAQKALANLAGKQQERFLTVEALRPSKASGPLPAVFDTTDIEILRSEAVKCYLQLQTQSALFEKLQTELEQECQNANALRTENQALRQMTVTMQSSIETEEEARTNKLLKRITMLKKEKEDLLTKLELEEEMITNTLNRKLSKLQKEKIDMEVALEQEQEYIVNRLQKQLDTVRAQLGSPAGKGPLSSPSTSSMNDVPIPDSVSDLLRAEINATKIRIHDMEKEMQEYQKSASELYSKLRQDTVQLLERVGGDTEDLDKKFPVFLPAIYLALHERSRSVSSEASRWNSHGPGSHPGPDGYRRTSRSVSSNRGSINAG